MGTDLRKWGPPIWKKVRLLRSLHLVVIGTHLMVTAANEEVLKAAVVLQGCPITGAFTQKKVCGVAE
jgi:hypothetical protein